MSEVPTLYEWAVGRDAIARMIDCSCPGAALGLGRHPALPALTEQAHEIGAFHLGGAQREQEIHGPTSPKAAVILASLR